MSHDPYKPPEAPVSDPKGPPPRRGSMVRALVVGTLIEVVGTLIVGLGFGIVYGAILGASGMDQAEAEAALRALDPWSGPGLVASALGAFVSVFAGFAAAALAHRSDYVAVAAMAGISVSLGLLGGGASEESVGAVLGLSAVTVAMVFLGGWLHVRDMWRA